MEYYSNRRWRFSRLISSISRFLCNNFCLRHYEVELLKRCEQILWSSWMLIFLCLLGEISSFSDGFCLLFCIGFHVPGALCFAMLTTVNTMYWDYYVNAVGFWNIFFLFFMHLMFFLDFKNSQTFFKLGCRRGIVVFAAAWQPGSLQFQSRPSFKFFFFNFLSYRLNLCRPTCNWVKDRALLQKCQSVIIGSQTRRMASSIYPTRERKIGIFKGYITYSNIQTFINVPL